MVTSVFLEGFGIGASLIVAIGAQNAFVLRQGIARNQVFLVASICSLIDAILIMAGVLGLGSLISAFPLVLRGFTLVGAAFLIWYGIRSLGSAINPKVIDDEAPPSEKGSLSQKRAVILALLAFSLLNPHVYLDTVILLGSIGSRHQWPQRIWFIVGAVCASFTWFFGLAYGARLLTPLFRKKVTWRILDCLIAFIMFLIAVQLLIFGIQGS